MKPTYSRSRSIAFTILTSITALANIGCAFLNYVIWSEGAVAEGIYDRMVDSPWALEGNAAAMAVLVFIGTSASYFLSFDLHRPRRPYRRVALLLFSLALFISGYLLGTGGVAPDHFPLFIGVFVACAIIPLPIFWLERLLGKAFLRSARALYMARKPRPALHLVRLGLRFYPANAEGETFYGLSLAARGDAERALPYLEHAYAQEHRTPEILQALADIYERHGHKTNAVRVLEELQQLRPSPETFARIIQIRLATGEETRALADLGALPYSEKQPWLDTIYDVLLKRNSAEELHAYCRDVEQEGPPYTRTLSCLQTLHERHPLNVSVLEDMIRLSDVNGDRKAVMELLQELVELVPDDSESRRRLVEFYRVQRRTADVLKHLEELVKRDATVGEKMEVIEHLFENGNYSKAERLITEDERLSENGRAAGLLAFIYFETGRRDEALEQSERARALSPDSRTAADLSGMEQVIVTEKSGAELKDLEKRIAADPANLELRFSFLERLIDSGSVERIVVDLERIVTAEPELRPRVRTEIEKWIETHGRSFRLLNYLADLYLRDQQYDRVHEIYTLLTGDSITREETRVEGAQKVLRENPDHIPSLYEMAQVSDRAAKPQEAINYLDKYYAAGGERNDAALDLDLRNTLQLRLHSRAETIAHEILQHHPEDKEMMLKLAELALDQKKFPTGIEYFQRALALDPDNRDIKKQLRDAQDNLRHARMEEIRSTIAAGRDNPQLYEELGDLAHDFGLLNEAIVAYQKSAQAGPEHNVARAKLGYVLAKKGLFPDAEEALDDAALTPDQPAEEQLQLKSLFFSAGELMEQDGEEPRALKIYKRVFRVDAGYRDVVERVERLQRATEPKRNPKYR